MQKFRPYLTSSELTEILNCLKTKSSNIALIRYLETFAIKIDRGTIQPNLTLQPPKPTIEQSLGLDSSNPSNSLPRETTNHQAYLKYAASPTSCSPKEIEQAEEYMYLQGLMSASQEEAYYSNLMSQAKGTVI